jgi:anti-sigma factor ChrR (cupin superfamily)
MKEISINYGEMEWKDTTGYPAGTKIKILRKEGTARTFLLKIPKEFIMPAHSHMTVEQHFVLEGNYKSEGKEYGPGSFRLIPREIDHGPFTSESGAIILVVWDPL